MNSEFEEFQKSKFIEILILKKNLYLEKIIISGIKIKFSFLF